jgi:putative cardiolipin synthase
MHLWFIFLFILAFNLKASDEDPYHLSLNSSHQIALINGGLGSLEERLQMIERANKSIDIEYYIYKIDKSGRIFTQALIKKAREGVKVRMLLDYFGVSSYFTPFYAYEMQKYGIEVKYFNPASVLNPLDGQYRNHRKILMIDGQEVITGGRNIADEYFDLREDFNFLDRDIFVSGPIVSSIQKTFDNVWNSEISVKIDRYPMPMSDGKNYRYGNQATNQLRFKQDLKFYKQEVAHAVEFLSVPNDQVFEEKMRSVGRIELAKEYRGTCDNISFNSERPIIGSDNDNYRIIKYDLSNRIKMAKESILLDSPYFIVDDDLKIPLGNALTKKVNVTLLTNSLYSTDAIFVYASFNSNIKDWIKKGLRAYIFKGNMTANYPLIDNEISGARFGVHAKTFVFDKKDTVIGTYNFDPRSANLNIEMTIACNNNPALAGFVTENINERIQGSIFLDSNMRVDSFEYYKTGIIKMMGYYLLKIPSNLFDYLL